MPTLNAMFKLFDGYSSTASKVIRKTDEVANKVLKASGATDNFNNKLKKTGANMQHMHGHADGFLASVKSITVGMIAAEVAMAGMQSIGNGVKSIDMFTNTAARLSLINDGLQTQAELQDKIFAAAYRSRGAYSDMANAVAKMGLLAGDAFGSNNELIRFTELLQKSFKVSGASTQEQQAGMYQLTQSMAAGKLQGDEFRSIMENAPMLASAIAKYTGKTKGELKQMSADGTISASIIKNAMFMAADDIEAKFKTMPMTFADVWTQIKNGSLKAFQPIIEKISTLINSPGFTNFINSFVGGLMLMAFWIEQIGGFIQSNWGIIEPMLYGIAGALALITFGIMPPMLFQWIAMNWPILLIGAAIGLLIYAMVKFGDVTSQVFGYIGGGIGVLLALIYNLMAFIANGVLTLGDFVVNIFVEMINSVIGLINLAISGLNKIPGVDIGVIGSVDQVNTQKYDYANLGDAWTYGQDIGKSVGGSLSGLGSKFSSMAPDFNSMGGLDSYMTKGAMPVTGVNGGKVEVDMSDEDLKYLRDIAERDYINKFSTATLAPNITVTFGDVHEEADANKVAGRIRKILQEEIATTAEGAYA
jgi:tape measure domain-containing protein